MLPRRLLLAFLALLAFGAAAAPAAPMPDFQRLERELRLKPHQRAQYDVAVLSLKRALIASAASLLEVKQQLAEELTKQRPDFLALLERNRAAYELAAPLYREALEEWGRLYALLEDDQVLIARRFLREALDGMRLELPGMR